MVEYVHLYEHPGVNNLNMDFLMADQDYDIEDLVVICMKELEAVENITIESVDTVYNMDEIDINEHLINKNYKKKNDDTVIPRYKYMNNDIYAEMSFGIRIKTNLNEKFIVKKILIPVMVDGFLYVNNKKAKAIWQMLEASVYTQRGKITLKSRMPIVLYKNKSRVIKDVNEVEYPVRPFSYAMANTTKKRKNAPKVPKKKANKFINPMMIFSAKVGVDGAIKFMGMNYCINITTNFNPTSNYYLYFPLDEVYIRVNKEAFESVPMVQSVVGMLCNIGNKDYPVSLGNLNDTQYWISRVGFIGAPKDKPLKQYGEKGKTVMYMIERLYDTLTKMNLRLPEEQKSDIYCVLRWMMYEYDILRQKDNLDVNNKRIRKNEYIVKDSLGRKLSENVNNLIPKLSESHANDMDTLLELFNFPSAIILNGLKMLTELVKTDDLVNDMNILEDMAYSSKGPEALGEDSSKTIPPKSRDVHPSFIGVIDPNCSSNSDVGMTGAISPMVKIYDRFYFTPVKEPCHTMMETINAVNKIKQKTIVDVTPEDNEDNVNAVSLDVKSLNPKMFDEWLRIHDEEVGITMAPIRVVEKDEATIQAIRDAQKVKKDKPVKSESNTKEANIDEDE